MHAMPFAAELPAIEPAEADLHAIARGSWTETQQRIEQLLIDAAAEITEGEATR